MNTNQSNEYKKWLRLHKIICVNNIYQYDIEDILELQNIILNNLSNFKIFTNKDLKQGYFPKELTIKIKYNNTFIERNFKKKDV